MQKLTYRQSGVNVDGGNEFVRRIKKFADGTKSPSVLSSIGGFGAPYDISGLDMKEPIFVSSADGVGTKIKLAVALGKYDTVGIDCVAMNVNDILTVGAKPLFFLDYLAVGKLKVEIGAKIVEGVAKGCSLADCSLIGGETAEMASVYRRDDFDLAGFCVGVVEKEKMIGGEGISEGDIVVGLKSSGFHSNGYSLVNKVVKSKRLDLSKTYPGLGRSLGSLLIAPTKIYVREVLELLEKVPVKGMAHITGGSFKDKLSRIIPDGLCAIINRNSWNLPPIFSFIQERGGIDYEEMYRTFNCGIGFVIVTGQEEARLVLDFFGSEAVEIGYVSKNGSSKVNLF